MWKEKENEFNENGWKHFIYKLYLFFIPFKDHEYNGIQSHLPTSFHQY